MESEKEVVVGASGQSEEQQDSVPLLSTLSLPPYQEAARHDYGAVTLDADADLLLEDEEDRVEEEATPPARPSVDLRKYVFLSMGIPAVVSAPPEFKRNCSKSGTVVAECILYSTWWLMKSEE